MGKVVGGLLRGLATLFYLLDFLLSAAILGIYSYYIATLHRHNLPIGDQWRAVEGLSGAAVLYTIFAVLLTCFLGGIGFFAFLGMCFDAIFCGAMIAIAVLVRHGAHTCHGRVTTTLGTGNVNATAPTGLSYRIACDLDLAVLIIACVAALSFLISFFLQLLINRHRAQDKYKGPNTREEEGVVAAEPEKRGFFGRRAKSTREAYRTEPEMAVVDGPTTNGGLVANDATYVRPSHDSHVTGTTLGQPTDGYVNGNKYENNKYENHPAVPAPQFTTTTGPNIVSSTTTTRDAYYDPNAVPATTGPNGFVAPRTQYIPGQQSNNF